MIVALEGQALAQGIGERHRRPCETPGLITDRQADLR
jgi:hypothetical protein